MKANYIKVRIFVLNFWKEIFLNYTYENMEVEFIRINSFSTYKSSCKKDGAKCIVFLRYSQFEGLGKANHLKLNSTKSKVIVIDDSFSPAQVIKSLQLGVHGYLHNPTLPELYSTVYSVVNEKFALNEVVVSSLASSFRLNIDSPLTRREQEILQELSKGSSYKLICEHLFISLDTVRTHIRNIYYKLDATSKDVALEKARSYSLI